MENKYTVLDMSSWYRRETYHLFKDYDDPFFNITANVRVEKILAHSKKNKLSFHTLCLYCCLKVVNSIPELCTRIKEGNAIQYHQINGGSTVLLKNKAFGFAYFDYKSNFEEFYKSAQQEMELAVKNQVTNPREEELNRVHFTSIPWISFTSFKHAHISRKNDSIPKITFGKYFSQNDNMLMPISILCHHGLADGYHVGLFFERLESELENI